MPRHGRAAPLCGAAEPYPRGVLTQTGRRARGPAALVLGALPPGSTVLGDGERPTAPGRRDDHPILSPRCIALIALLPLERLPDLRSGRRRLVRGRVRSPAPV